MGFLTNKKFYLSGPIEFGSENWREPIIEKLKNDFSIDVYDPFSDPKQQWVDKIIEAKAKHDYQAIQDIAKKFVRKDLGMVDRSDGLIAYLPYKVPTTGTHHEIINSINSKKPTLLVCPQGKENVPVWYYGISKIQHMFGSWDELFVFLKEVNEGHHQDDDKWSFVYDLV